MGELRGRGLTVGIAASCGLGFLLFGYDQGVFGGLLANPSFQEVFNDPNAEIQSQIVSTYTLGCIFGAILTIFTGDPLGRRRSVLFGCTLLVIGGVLQASAYTLPHMIVGRIVSGFGIGINTTTIPMWHSETSRPEIRGRLVAFELTSLVFGFVITNWMNFGFTYIPNSEISWRFPLGFQAVLAAGTAAFVPFLVESPRWLVLKDRTDEARIVISRLLNKPIDDREVREFLDLMIETIAREKAEGEIGWKEVIHNGPNRTRHRILLGMGANIFQQIGGVNVVAYYLPVVLERSFNFTPRMALILSACDSMQWMFWGAMAMWTIERFGRRRMMLFGASGCSLCFAIVAIGLGVNNKVSNGVAVAFIFIFYFFFGMSFMAIGFLYPSEINSNRSRNHGAAIAMVTNWVGVYIVVSITPIGIQDIGWRFYIIFAVTNLCFIPIIWLLYPETAQLSLDEIDWMFHLKYASDTKMTYKEATLRAKEHMEQERAQIRLSRTPSGEKEVVEHKETTV